MVVVLAVGIAAAGCGDAGSELSRQPDLEWTHVAGDASGTRFSSALQITPSNVRRLTIAWTSRMGGADSAAMRARVEVTPVMTGGVLYVSTPHGRVLALDAATGARKWTYDAHVDPNTRYTEGLTTRGVALWTQRAADLAHVCSRRVFAVTVDARLHAIDANDGAPCSGFGDRGIVSLRTGAGIGGRRVSASQISQTSPPIVVGDVVIVGSAVNGQLARPEASGVVRAFDARTGVPKWSFDAIPRSRGHPFWSGWDSVATSYTGGGNVWSIMSGDEDLDLVFLPTASASPNHFGGDRPGRNELANSVVALRASTGEYVWSFQTVHHDLWDYDVASQPLLVSLEIEGQGVDALIVMNKAGMVFVLDRRTGRPLSPAEERTVPTSRVNREAAWPTQPFSFGGLRLNSSTLSSDSIFGVTSDDLEFCRRWFERSRYEGPFTPPSTEGSIVWPGVWGGPNWDGGAWDPGRKLLVVPVRRVAFSIQLVPLRLEGALPSRVAGEQRFPGLGGPYIVRRIPFVAMSGVPCTPPPWSELKAIDMATGEILWSKPLGTVSALASERRSSGWGSLAFGGPLLTESGLTFIAASQDNRIRALSTQTGELLWEFQLPAGGQAAPLTYVVNGQQYVVIVAGGRGGIGDPGDFIVAFALK